MRCMCTVLIRPPVRCRLGHCMSSILPGSSLRIMVWIRSRCIQAEQRCSFTDPDARGRRIGIRAFSSGGRRGHRPSGCLLPPIPTAQFLANCGTTASLTPGSSATTTTGATVMAAVPGAKPSRVTFAPRPARLYPAGDGARCADDANVCTNDVCDGEGHCYQPLVGAPLSDDDNPCTGPGVCDGSGACTHAYAPQGTACPDPRPDNNACTIGWCDSAAANVSIRMFLLVRLPGDSNLCTSDVCNAHGQCTHPAAPDGTACLDNGNVCDGVETCRHGVCKSCPIRSDGTACQDNGNFCDGVETCQRGIC